MNPAKYGHKFDDGENLVPAVITELSILVSFSIPCNYSKCSQPVMDPPPLDKYLSNIIFTISEVKIG